MTDSLPSPTRNTPFWRKQGDLLRQAFAETPHNPILRAAWGHLTLLWADKLGLTVDLIDPGEAPGIAAFRSMLGDEASDVERVLALIELWFQQNAPAVSFALGIFLPRYLLARVHYQLTGEIPFWAPKKILRFLPNIPLWLDANGAIRDWDQVDPKEMMRCFQFLRDYRQSLKPPRPRGRPRKTEPTAPSKGALRLDPALARLAYGMANDGADWKTIAKVG
jgi:hypothetical protein